MKQFITLLAVMGGLAGSSIVACSVIDNQSSGSSAGNAPSKVLVIDQNTVRYPHDGVTIKDASIVGDSLTMLVSYPGGCKTHDLKVISNGAMMKSMPPQLNVELSHDAHEDMCEAVISQDVTVSLEPLKQQASNGGIVLHVEGFDKPLTYRR